MLNETITMQKIRVKFLIHAMGSKRSIKVGGRLLQEDELPLP